MGAATVTRHENNSHPDWNVELINTGVATLTGGRIKRLGPYIGNHTFMLTGGDGVSNVDLNKSIEFDRSHSRLATVAAVRPPARFGHMTFDGDRVLDQAFHGGPPCHNGLESLGHGRITDSGRK